MKVRFSSLFAMCLFFIIILLIPSVIYVEYSKNYENSISTKIINCITLGETIKIDTPIIDSVWKKNELSIWTPIIYKENNEITGSKDMKNPQKNIREIYFPHTNPIYSVRINKNTEIVIIKFFVIPLIIELILIIITLFFSCLFKKEETTHEDNGKKKEYKLSNEELEGLLGK